MNKVLFPLGKKIYKANLHVHTTISDGNVTAEQVKDAYKAQGYSIVAFTDHEVLIDHSDLDDENFLAITSYEWAVGQRGVPYKFGKTCDLNLYALDQHNTTQVCFDPEKVWHSTAEEIAQVKYHGKLYKSEYSPECINEVIREAKKHGFLVCWNHPDYSLEDFDDIWMKYEGYDAMEIFNTGSRIGGWPGDNSALYDRVLRSGKLVFPIAADDSHGLRGKHPLSSNFGGFCMIAADELDYSMVMQALQKGDFYASTGPTIDKIWVEGDKVCVECPPAVEINFRTGSRRGRMNTGEGRSPITYAEFQMERDDKYVYIAVKSPDGEWAYTRAFTTDEIFD